MGLIYNSPCLAALQFGRQRGHWLINTARKCPLSSVFRSSSLGIYWLIRAREEERTLITDPTNRQLANIFWANMSRKGPLHGKWLGYSWRRCCDKLHLELVITNRCVVNGAFICAKLMKAHEQPIKQQVSKSMLSSGTPPVANDTLILSNSIVSAS